ncbi:MAG: adenylosuccinate lyase [Hymenobacteraceae bacterium]|nr:adenylosuccinate lyase [Hymenobacteraceae bacterium]
MLTPSAPTPLTALSPLDGRYHAATAPLTPYFSEFGLLQYRVRVEFEYFIALCNLGLPQLASVRESDFPTLRRLWQGFSLADAERIKQLELVTNHDVKAVEYWLKERFQHQGLSAVSEFIHFGLTSQDVNNTAQPLALREALHTVLLPAYEAVLDDLQHHAESWLTVPLLARTHGQAASPTLLGRELLVFVERLMGQLDAARAVPHSAKFGGATGGFNAHHVAYPAVDWPEFADEFVADLGLSRAYYTTQIEPYDNLAALCDALKRLNTILIDLCRDAWQYISLGYFGQRLKEGEIGSSAMPHKVNPIDFENAEGNLGIANALLEHMAAKLPISRLQRDLTDSTVLRNVGVPLGHTLLALTNLRRGLGKLTLNEAALHRDLADNWAVVAEGIQTILRREGYPQPYEALKALTRTGETISQTTIQEFITSLDIADAVKKELRALSPFTYTGMVR